MNIRYGCYTRRDETRILRVRHTVEVRAGYRAQALAEAFARVPSALCVAEIVSVDDDDATGCFRVMFVEEREDP